MAYQTYMYLQDHWVDDNNPFPTLEGDPTFIFPNEALVFRYTPMNGFTTIFVGENLLSYSKFGEPFEVYKDWKSKLQFQAEYYAAFDMRQMVRRHSPEQRPIASPLAKVEDYAIRKGVLLTWDDYDDLGVETIFEDCVRLFDVASRALPSEEFHTYLGNVALYKEEQGLEPLNKGGLISGETK